MGRLLDRDEADPERLGAAMNMDELRQLVERKMETVKALEALLAKEETELVELEKELEALEDERQQTHAHPRCRVRR